MEAPAEAWDAWFIADVNAESNETDWAQTNGPYGGHVYTLYATPEGVLFAGMSSAGIYVQRISAILGRHYTTGWVIHHRLRPWNEMAQNII